MRSTSLPKTVLVAALAALALTGCGTNTGTKGATTDQALAGSGVSVAASPEPEVPQSDDEAEMRFLEVMTNVLMGCSADVPTDKGGEAPMPEDRPGWEAGGPPPADYGPGPTPPTPPTAPNGDVGVPVPLDDVPAPPEPTSAPAEPTPAKEVPLTGGEQCFGDGHAQRIAEAFKNTKTDGYQAMHKKLTGLDYPAARIHRMPDHAGAPRVRIDLRMMGGHAALEVTATSGGVHVEVFGSPETEDVNVADVERAPKRADAPTS